MQPLSLIKKYGWLEWITHTNFSFLTGASHPEEIVKRSWQQGYSGVGVCDYDGVYGLARAYLDLKRIKNPAFSSHKDVSFPASMRLGGESPKRNVRRGEVCAPAPLSQFRLFFGVELHLRPDHNRPVAFQDTLILYAQNQQGYKNICSLCTYAHRDGKAGAFVTLEELAQMDVRGVIAIQPMRGVLRDPQLLHSSQQQARFAFLREHFSSRLYMALSRHLSPVEDVWITNALELSKRCDVPTIYSQDAFFHKPSRKALSDVLHAIRHNKTLDQCVDQMFPNSERSLHSLMGIAQRYGDLPGFEASLKTSRAISETIEFSLEQLRYDYPKEMIPDGLGAQDYLEVLVWRYASEIYGNHVPEKIRILLDKELQLVKRLRFADYFLTVWDIVCWARQKEILCQGRGSAANSAICFVLGITAVDPALYDLVFERFISVERGDPPDIDVDFEHERREEVIQYIYQRYGRKRAAMVANVITFRSKGALRAVGRALGIGNDVLTHVSNTLDSKFFRKSNAEDVLKKISTDYSKTNVEQLHQQKDGVPWRLWGEMAELIKGFPRHMGIHSGGFMLADKDIDFLVAQEPATMEGRTVIQWCKDDIEGLGFFKIDILSLGMLTAIRKCLFDLKTKYNIPMTLSSIPQEDPATYAMIQRADTVGTFQVESRAQMSMLPRLRPRTFYDMVIEVAIIRPGPIQGGMVHPYLRRRNGEEKIVFPDERLRPILARTLGVPIFQEQVMRIAMAVGGFSPGEANELRKNMGAWSMKGDLEGMLPKLAEGMKSNGLSEIFIKSLIQQMRGFADYGFPESHSVSFALLAYASCYLKCHFPAAFFCSILNSQPMGFYSPHALIQAAKRVDVKIMPVCVNISEWDHKLERVAGDDKMPIFGIRLGLRMVVGLSEKAADKIVAARHQAGGCWIDADGFLRDIQVHRNDLTSIAAANALQCFGLDRRSALWIAEAAPHCPVLEDIEEQVHFDPEGRMEKIEQDFSSMQLTLESHPARVMREDYWHYDVPSRSVTLSKDIVKKRAGSHIHVFGMVLIRQAPPSANGMVFLTLEDEHGFINLALPPQCYSRFYGIIDQQSFICAKGRVQLTNESHSLLVTNIYPPLVFEADVLPLSSAEDIADRVSRWQMRPPLLSQGELFLEEPQVKRELIKS